MGASASRAAPGIGAALGAASQDDIRGILVELQAGDRAKLISAALRATSGPEFSGALSSLPAGDRDKLLGSLPASLSSGKKGPFKVCVCGGAGGIGQPLSMFMSMDPNVKEVSVFDLSVAMVPPAGVAADLGHFDKSTKVKGYVMPVGEKAIDHAGEALSGCSLVLIPAGMPRKPGQTRDDLFKINADIAKSLVEACGKYCPDAIVCLIVNPVNSIVPAMAELYKKKNLDPLKIIGVTTLDCVRAAKFVGEITDTNPGSINVPVIGGHAGKTILPLFSQDDVSSTIDPSKIPDLDVRVQDAGTEVVNAKGGKGSATLSMGYAGARFASSILAGLAGGRSVECAYLQSSVMQGLKYFTSKVVFGPKGVQEIQGVGRLNDHEARRLEEVKVALNAEVQTGLDYAAVNDLACPTRENSLFADVPVAPPDAILTLASLFKEDKDPRKVNCGIGAYRTEDGKPWILPSVRTAELAVVNDPGADKEYVPIDGKPEHKKPVQQLIFSNEEIEKGTIATCQTLSGTGALQMVGQFLSNFLAVKTIHMPNPTWGNHAAIFKRAGLASQTYTYYHPPTRGFDFEGMIAAVSKLPEGDAILLHACAQNPTGVDPTPSQWEQIVQLCKDRKLVPVIDNAYQGYASGSLEQDNVAQRLFEKSGQEYFITQSFAKNLGLYGERIGYIHVRCSSKNMATAALSQLKILIRQAYSSPPRHGAAIVHKILATPDLKSQWLGELKFMSNRILQMRSMLKGALDKKGTPGTWNHITDQIGMFSFTGLAPLQVEKMVNEFHIYMTKDGRISVAGLNPGNVDYVAECIDKAVRS